MVKYAGVFPDGFSSNGDPKFKVICGKCGNECNRRNTSATDSGIREYLCPSCGEINDVEKIKLQQVYEKMRREFLGHLGV